ncbi:hypothetical protein [Dehalococcoides mccartyi]|uniref:Reductive dehalogenase anchoring protein n=2 Tax=Dehalococcoides mccartyi TaxID=61435 RepID=A0A2J1DV78_9CHLR|nr:hypothetical protein [Dehalococcoides mccartyi]OBW63521.1 MAG: dehalogenase [Dehalococcoides mccartyi]PKH46035.1 hypothetical protein CVH13_01286 [Dehalococcoides mccartyi]CAI82357.1 putative reductive dehalogenase anchoring protein [Dehalococcoides mccartyi CBDB1]
MWFFIGLIIGVALLALVLWLKRKVIRLSWYDWVIGFIAFIFGVLAVQHYMASVSHGELKAGLLGLGIFGVIAIVLALLDWQLIARRKKV